MQHYQLLHYPQCYPHIYLHLEGLTPWRILGMNKINSSSIVMFSLYQYSLAYELDYSSYVMIIAYELAYSFYVMT
jgi:hypothetical protein